MPDTATDVIFQLPILNVDLDPMPAEMAEDFLPTEQSCEQRGREKECL